MRRHVLPLLSLLFLVPLGQSASLSAEIVSTSPVELFGTLSYQNEGLRVFHLAANDGSLRGMVYNGTLFEHRRIVHSGCLDSQAPHEQRTVVHDVRSGDLAHTLRVELAQHAQAIFIPKQSSGMTVAQGAAKQAADPNAAPPLYLTPNPYLHASVPTSGGSGTHSNDWAEAFSQDAFLLVPTERFDSTRAGVLSLESGQLRISRAGQDYSYTARKESQEIQCSPVSLTRAMQTTTYSYQLLIETGTLAFEQASVDRMMQYFRGDRELQPVAPRPRERAPPPGQWYLDDGPGLADAYDQLSLPNTFLTAPKHTLNAAGAARLKDAFGTITENGTITEIDRKDIVLSGQLLIAPVAAEEGGRRMTTRLEGDLFLLDVALGGTSTDWTPAVAGAAAGMIGVGLAAYVWPTLRWKGTQFLLFPLYARLKREDILENPLRDDILHVVQSTPGISASELGRRLECGWGTLVYHITVLERMGLVSSAREGRHKRFFAQGRINYSDKSAVGLLANPAARNILDAVQQHPGVIQKDLSDRLGLAPGTISWHIERLTAEGLVIKEEDGRVVRYFPSSRLLELTKQLAA